MPRSRRKSNESVSKHCRNEPPIGIRLPRNFSTTSRIISRLKMLSHWRSTQPIASRHQDGPHAGESSPRGCERSMLMTQIFFSSCFPVLATATASPETVRQWKTRIEALDADDSFSVGLLYGRSGCGKSSFVRAGLLPRLSRNIQSIYFEATSDGTEELLLRKLANKFPHLPTENLAETLAELRRGTGLAANHKVLLVIDQFEQWLHGKNSGGTAHLGTSATALRRQSFAMFAAGAR